MKILSVILAGGRARGAIADKPFVPLAGRPLLAHGAARLVPQVARLVVATDGDRARLADLGLDAIDDGPMAGNGPLSGLHAALLLAQAEGFDAVLSAPCDMPFLPPDLAARLHAAGPPAIALSAGRMHHMVGLWPVLLLRDLAMSLSEPYSRAMEAWVDRHRPRRVLWSSRPYDPFLNINTPAEFSRAQALSVTE
jgi:molybdopterin-guanine dinucleotide biosynthesis protein A